MKKGFRLLFLLVSTHFSFAQYQTTSVLASGDWYKIAVSQSGIYKVDYNFLKSAGINPDKTDPRNIRIYGNGGGMLPQNNSISRTDDLAENAVYVKGESDGKFDSGDYILFYAQGPDTWTFDVANNIFTHNKNIYSDAAYYFITVSDSAGKRVPQSQTSCDAASAVSISEFDDRVFSEKDAVNILKSGREWYGDIFDGTNAQSFSFNLPGIISNSDINIRSDVAVKPSVGAYTYFNYSLNSKSIGSIPIAGFTACTLCQLVTASSKSFSINSSQITASDNLSVSVSYDKSRDYVAAGYLNFIELNVKRDLRLYGNQTAFRSIASKGQATVMYNIKGLSSTSMIWDISTLTSPVNILSSSCVATDGLIKEYVSFEPDQINLTPVFLNKIVNQNLHALPSPYLIIITHPSLLAEANRLADFRKQQGISTEVVTVEQIYNEFSSGAQDITAIRDFCRMLYKKGNLKSLLLFGGCSYDYKDRVTNNNNLVPCYESRQSFHDINSFSSEDYYAFYGDNEGDWFEDGSKQYDYLMQIGIGRIPVNNPDEASAVVNKLINYSSENAFGKWRNRITFMADNGDNDLHSDSANRLADNVGDTNSNLNINKIFIDAFPLESTPSGNKVPGANEALRNTLNQGALIINYTGHGGVEVLAQEHLVTIADIKSWTNFNKLPFFMTATCDFSTYDNPNIASAGVLTLTQPKGGGIGLISATRPVYSNSNDELNKAFYNTIFTADSLGNMPDLGEVIRETKNNSLHGINNRSYTLLTDPSMKLAYPSYKAIVSKITNLSSPYASDTIKALSIIALEGEVYLPGTTITATNFNGVLYCDIYDKYTTLYTLGQTSDSPSMSYKLQNSLLYSGQATVTNGKYNLSFVVPKDINYQLGAGKISLYAYDSKNLVDAAGYNKNMIVGGSNPLASADTIPPTIELYMNDTTFISGNYTSSKPVLIAKLYDANGINIARSAIGHEITSVLSTEQDNIVILNDYYTASLNSYSSGKVEYSLDSLADGSHTITVKAWDTYNNSSSASIDFIVASNGKMIIQQLLNYPNPAIDKTTFQFSHNKAGTSITVTLQIYDRMGRLVKEINEDLSQSSSTVDIPWDIKDDSGYNMPAGMYVYKCAITSKNDGSQTQAFQKLVLIY